MGRVRVSTTVDGDLLTEARRLRPEASTATLIDEALAAVVAHHREAEIDAAYAAAYTEHPLDEPDEWGDLESFLRAASRS